MVQYNYCLHVINDYKRKSIPMKKVIGCVIGLLIFNCGNAQKLQLRPSVAIGSSFTSPGTNIDFDEIPIDYSNKFKASYAIGIGAEYSLSKHWALGADVLFSREGKAVHYKESGDGAERYDFDDFSTVRYFRVPVTANFYFLKPENKLRPYLTAGLNVGLLLGQGNGHLPNNEYTTNYMATVGYRVNAYKNFDIGLQMGAGVHYKLNAKSSIFVAVQYYRGVVSPAVYDLPSQRNENARVQVGYSFGL